MPVLNDITNGSVISFRSKAVNDNNVYFGKVVGIVSSLIAQTYSDIFTYNSSVQSNDPDVPTVDLQSFFIIQLRETVDNTDRHIIPFSGNWINLPSLTIITSNKITLIKVYDVDTTNSQNVIDLLRTAGFKAKVESYL